MNLKEKMNVIENYFGSGSAAAEAAGVTHTSWSRWKSGKPEPQAWGVKIIDLLYEKAIAKVPKKASA